MLDQPISDQDFNQYSGLHAEAKVLINRAKRIAQLLVEEFAPDSAPHIMHGVGFAPGADKVVATCRTLFGDGRIRLAIAAKNGSPTGLLIVERADEDALGRMVWSPVWSFAVPQTDKLVVGVPPNQRWTPLNSTNRASDDDAIYALGMSINYAIASQSAQ